MVMAGTIHVIRYNTSRLSKKKMSPYPIFDSSSNGRLGGGRYGIRKLATHGLHSIEIE